MNEKEYFEKEYMPKMNRIGKLTGYFGVLLSFCPAICLAVIYGQLPDWKALPLAFVTGAATFGFLWVVEPISYFPVLGPVGTYMAFLSGNISNMRVPCAAMAQSSAGVEPGSDKGTVISAVGMAVSVIINVSVLTVGVIFGSSVLSALPPTVTEALNYLLPALFGALLVQFSMKRLPFGAAMLLLAILVYFAIKLGLFNWLPGAANYLPTLASVFLAIAVSLSMESRKEKTKKAGSAD